MLQENYLNLKSILKIISDDRFQKADPIIFTEALRDFCQSVRVPNGIKDYKQTSYLVFRHAEKFCFYYENVEAAKKIEPQDTYKMGFKRIITSDDDEAHYVMGAFNISIKIWKQLINSYISGKPDFQLVGQIFNVVYLGNEVDHIELWPQDKKPAKPLLWLLPKLVTFEDVLEYLGIIFYYQNGLEVVFDHIRQCQNPECRRYFLPANPKASFCQESCRQRLRYLTRIGENIK